MKFVAFLRGINVGGRTIKMDDLKAHFVSSGYSDVVTVLQSGNVIFSSDQDPAALKLELEASLTSAFGYPAKVQIRSVDELKDVIGAYPFDESDGDNQNYVIFLENGLEQDLFADAAGLEESVEQIKAGNGVLYWQVPKGQTLKSQFAQYLTKAKYKTSHTNRNINTLRKIVG